MLSSICSLTTLLSVFNDFCTVQRCTEQLELFGASVVHNSYYTVSKSLHYIFMFLTSALCAWVSPVVLLAVCAGLPSKSIPTLTLTCKLHDRKWNNSNMAHQLLSVSMRTYLDFEYNDFRSKHPLPRYMRR